MQQQRLREESSKVQERLREAFKSVEEFQSMVGRWTAGRRGRSAQRREKEPSHQSLKEYDLRAKYFTHQSNDNHLEGMRQVNINTVKRDSLQDSTAERGHITTAKKDPTITMENKESPNHRQKEGQSHHPPSQEQLEPKAFSCQTLQFSEGWKYVGEIVLKRFHGHGELYNGSTLIYMGTFNQGRFHGYGKLKFIPHSHFHHLIQGSDKFAAYFGQFREGTITGFGQLWLQNGNKMIGKWANGKFAKGKIISNDASS